jgi:tetratricopeptide (TPR) repeat protein
VDNKLIPLFSISGLTIFSISGLIFFKSKDSITPISPQAPEVKTNSQSQVVPTQVPKSIEHYLLSSQQFFTQALEAQNTSKSPETVSNLLNRSLAFANESIKIFPTDFRAYVQRGQIYQSLTNSQNQLVDNAINDYLKAQKLNPNSAEITRTLANLYAKKGDAGNTLNFLSKTISLEPTKAQNFYDLARIQQQAGQIGSAVATYDKLLSILTDPNQKTQVLSEKTVLEKLISQNPQAGIVPVEQVSPQPSVDTKEPVLQALLPETGLIIAAPETVKDVIVSNQTESNSLSGNGILKAGQSKISIANSKLNSSSQVYVSIVSGGKNQTLEVISKTKESFEVGIVSAVNEDISFKWWIVN